MKIDIKIIQGDITHLKIGAIVNAANNSLLGGEGVDGAIHRAAGPRLLEECMTLHGCRTGQAKITRGYNLPAKYVIHTVGPVYSDKKSDPIFLAECYRNSLDVAKEHDIHSIAFPAISTGAYGYPAAAAAKIAYNTIKKWQLNHPDYKMEVIMCAFDSATYNLYQKIKSANATSVVKM